MNGMKKIKTLKKPILITPIKCIYCGGVRGGFIAIRNGKLNTKSGKQRVTAYKHQNCNRRWFL